MEPGFRPKAWQPSRNPSYSQLRHAWGLAWDA